MHHFAVPKKTRRTPSLFRYIFADLVQPSRMKIGLVYNINVNKVMKTTLLTLVLCLTGLSLLRAQTEKGRWTVGTSFGGLTYLDYDNNKSFSISLSPSAGYFVADNLLIGTGIPLSLSTQKPGSSNPYLQRSVNTGVGLSPYVRYYFGKSLLKPYIGLAYSHSFTNYRITSLSGSNESSTGFSDIISPGAGLAYFFNRTIALNAGLNYNIQRTRQGYFSPTSATETQIFTFDSKSRILSLSVGLQIFLGK